MKKLLKILLAFSMLGITGCKKKYQYLNTVFSGPFDTVIYYNAYVVDQKHFDSQVDMIKEEFTRLDQLFDKYTSYENLNNIKTINDNAGIQPVEVDPIIVDLIHTWLNEYSEISSKVNIALGPVLSLWHDARENAVLDSNNQPIGVPPTQEELTAAYQYCSTDYVIVDEEKNTVYLTDENASIDVGAIAKGYAVEYVKDQLIESGADSFLLSAGGNVACHGKRLAKADGNDNLTRSKKEFLVGINSPGDGAYEDYNLVALVIPTDLSIVTSGDYERYFLDADGNRYSHLIDGSTLYPASYFRSVTIITEDSGYADFLSTALFLMDLQSGIEFVNGLDGVEAIWLEEDGTITHTSGLVEGDNYYCLVK